MAADEDVRGLVSSGVAAALLLCDVDDDNDGDADDDDENDDADDAEEEDDDNCGGGMGDNARFEADDKDGVFCRGYWRWWRAAAAATTGVPIPGLNAIGFGLWCARAGDVDLRAGVVRVAAVTAAPVISFLDAGFGLRADVTTVPVALADDAGADGHATAEDARRGEAGAGRCSSDDEGARTFACHR